MTTLLRSLVASALVFASALPHTAHGSDLELRVRAAFLYNLAKFVTWPEQNQDKQQIEVCVLRGTEFETVLRTEIEGKPVGTRIISVVDLSPQDDMSGCHILHLEESQALEHLGPILEAVKHQPVLTVGYGPNFLREGGILRVKRDQGRLRFDIALSSGRSAGLRFSSKLLRLADLVSSSGDS